MIKKSRIAMLVLAVMLISICAGCLGNSGNLTEGLTNATNTFNYVLINEGGEYRLHNINRWKDSESDALGITTKCCKNQFWTSYNSAIMYTNQPMYLPSDIIVCGQVNHR